MKDLRTMDLGKCLCNGNRTGERGLTVLTTQTLYKYRGSAGLGQGVFDIAALVIK